MSKKIYKGYQLMKAIADGEIKEGSRFIFKTCDAIERVRWNGENFKYIDTKSNIMNDFADIELINGLFELIEDETIDIESINKLTDESKGTAGEFNAIKDKINELIEWAKQQEKRIKKLEEK